MSTVTDRLLADLIAHIRYRKDDFFTPMDFELTCNSYGAERLALAEQKSDQQIKMQQDVDRDEVFDSGHDEGCYFQARQILLEITGQSALPDMSIQRILEEIKKAASPSPEPQPEEVPPVPMLISRL